MDLKCCNICPRECGKNREDGELGYCKSSSNIKVAKAMIHHFEEPFISGEPEDSRGSGTVFFSNCPLKCVYCQNYNISHEGFGKEISEARLAEIFLTLQYKGAYNINLVTPTHYAKEIIESIKLARSKGLSIPIVYNTSGYEKPSTIKELNGYIDIYLTDIKYFNDKYSILYSNAKDYFKYASDSLKEMFSQIGKFSFDENEMMKKGVVVRHLMLPGLLFDSKKILDYVYSNFKDDVYISLMNQYVPMYKACNYPNINKTLNEDHYNSLIDYALNLGIKNALIQEKGSSDKCFIPDFDLSGVI
ncbi:MAG: radical SAM protein [Oscillospiraceae bacterium]|nr:radical SAM protein [Oscillospiraceae bacterium]